MFRLPLHARGGKNREFHGGGIIFLPRCTWNQLLCVDFTTEETCVCVGRCVWLVMMSSGGGRGRKDMTLWFVEESGELSERVGRGGVKEEETEKGRDRQRRKWRE